MVIKNLVSSFPARGNAEADCTVKRQNRPGRQGGGSNLVRSNADANCTVKRENRPGRKGDGRRGERNPNAEQ
jgi:hypothetical protein